MCCAAATPLWPSKTQNSPNESPSPSLLCLQCRKAMSHLVSAAPAEARQDDHHRNIYNGIFQCASQPISHLIPPVPSLAGVSLQKAVSGITTIDVSWHRRTPRCQRRAPVHHITLNYMKGQGLLLRVSTSCWRNGPGNRAEWATCSLLMSQSHRLMSAADEAPLHCLLLSCPSCLRLLEAQRQVLERSCRALPGRHPAEPQDSQYNL